MFERTRIAVCLVIVVICTAFTMAEPRLTKAQDPIYILVAQEDIIRMAQEFALFREQVKYLIGRHGEEITDEQILETLSFTLLDCH